VYSVNNILKHLCSIDTYKSFSLIVESMGLEQ